METVTVNMGKTRYATMQGRQYLVAPSTLLVSGVIPGSEGPMYYPPEEVSSELGIWNMIPMVVYHPEKEGQFVSARSADVIDKSGIGVVLNDAISEDGTRVAELWFDIEAVKRVDKTLDPKIQIWPRLQKELPIELSTGLFLEKNKAPQGSNHQGKPYDNIARNLKPDHLAILPDEEGACSNKDGCGVLVNQQEKGLFGRIADFFGLTPKESLVTVVNKIDEESTTELPVENPDTETPVEDTSTSIKETSPQEDLAMAMNKQQMVQYLTANCSCWKGQKDKDVLNNFDEEKLKALVENARKVIIVNAIKKGTILNKKKVKNADEESAPAGVDIAALADFLGITADPASDPLGFVKELQDKITEIQSKLGGTAAPPAAEAPAEATVMSSEATPQENNTMNAKQIFEHLPKSARNVLIGAINEKKIRLVRRLIANQTDPNIKKALAKKYLAKDVDTLQELVSLLPTNNQVRQTVVNQPRFVGSGSGNGQRVNNVADDDMLPVPGMQ